MGTVKISAWLMAKKRCSSPPYIYQTKTDTKFHPLESLLHLKSPNSTTWTQPIDPFLLKPITFLWWLWKWHDTFLDYSCFSKSTKDMHFQPHNCCLLFPFYCSFLIICNVSSAQRVLIFFLFFFGPKRSCRCECLIYIFCFLLVVTCKKSK